MQKISEWYWRKPKHQTDIRERVHKEFNYGVSKATAPTARAHAKTLVHGSFLEQYKRLNDYTYELMKYNEGSTVVLTTHPYEGNPEELENSNSDVSPAFHRLYICVKAFKDSFFKCRPIIGLDSCFLKGPFGGEILAAVGRDPNDQMLPIAYAVVEGENTNSWKWFMELLIKDLGGTHFFEVYHHIKPIKG